jgi:hypothetical protein
LLLFICVKDLKKTFPLPLLLQNTCTQMSYTVQVERIQVSDPVAGETTPSQHIYKVGDFENDSPYSICPHFPTKTFDGIKLSEDVPVTDITSRTYCLSCGCYGSDCMMDDECWSAGEGTQTYTKDEVADLYAVYPNQLLFTDYDDSCGIPPNNLLECNGEKEQRLSVWVKENHDLLKYWRNKGFLFFVIRHLRNQPINIYS